MRRITSVTSAVALALTTLIAGTAMAPQEASAAAVQQTMIGDFENGSENWRAANQNGATGVFSTANQAPARGASHGRLTASVPVGATAELARETPRIDAAGVQFSVRSADLDLITVRMRDSSGQTHQQRVTLDPRASGWQQVRLNSLTSGREYSSYGGAADGQWHGLLKGFSIVLDSWSFVEGKTSGVMDVDDIAVTLSPIRLTTVKTGNVFQVNEPVEVGLATESTEVSWIVRDGYGTVVEEGRRATSELGGKLPLGIRAPGWYAVEVTGKAVDDSYHRVGTDVGILRPLSADFRRDDRLGIATHYGQSWPIASAELVGKAGFGIARDEAYWDSQETCDPSCTTTPTFNWQRNVTDYEASFKRQAVPNLRVLSYGHRSYSDPGFRLSYPPLDDEARAAFADYARASFDRLNKDANGTILNEPAGKYFEVWNEWNYRDPQLTADDYVALLKVVRQKLSEAKLVGPALAAIPARERTTDYPGNPSWQDWFQDFIDAGGLQYVDYVSTHPYADPEDPETSAQRYQKQWSEMRTMMGAKAKPIMITETGWGTQLTQEGVTESEQAEKQVRGVMFALADKIENVTIYDLMDDGVVAAEREDRLGIVRNTDDIRGSFVPKPAYVASAVMNRALTTRAWQDGQTVKEEGVYWVEAFGEGDQRVRAAWALRPTTIAVQSTSDVTVTGMYGDVTTLSPNASREVYVTLGKQPVYISGTGVTGVTKSDRYRLSVQQEVSDQSVRGEVTMINASNQAVAVKIAPVGGVPVTASATSGTTKIPFDYSPQASDTERIYGAIAYENERAVALLRTEGTPTSELALAGAHSVTDSGEALRITVKNNRPTAIVLDGVDVTIGNQTVRLGAGRSIPANSAAVVEQPVTVNTNTRWSAATHVGEAVTVVEGVLQPLVPADRRTLVPRGTITVDGKVDGGLTSANALRGKPTPEGTQAADASTEIWYRYDDTNLSVTVRARDDEHRQNNIAKEMWKGDSVQIGLVAGAPGEQLVHQELGLARLHGAHGTLLTHQWRPALQEGTPNGLVAAVSRDEGTGITTYEMAIPWKLVEVDPGGRLLGSALVLNNDDGAGRDTTVSWGDGLAGPKDTSKFNTLVLQK